MSDIRRIQAGNRMSQAVIHNGTVYLAGQVANDLPGRSVTEQTADIVRRIDALLAEAGTDKSRLLSATVYLADIDAGYNDMNGVWDQWVVPGQTPARATVQAKLAAPGYDVEIAVIAAL